MSSEIEFPLEMARAALVLLPEDHPACPDSLDDLAGSLYNRYLSSGETDDLEESVSLARVVLVHRPEGHPDRHRSLANFGSTLRARYSHSGSVDDLEESISLQRAALALRPEGHPSRHHSLGSLANALGDRYSHSGSVGDLEESISLQRAALALRPEGHPSRHHSLGSLASALGDRYLHSGSAGDLEESISLLRAALALRPEGHPGRHHSLDNLAIALRDRYLHSGSVGDLEESISLHRAALALCPEGHPRRHHSLGGLAAALRCRYLHSGSVGDLEESISLQRAALALRPEGHPSRHHSLGSLANALRCRYLHSGSVGDLEESISLQRAALALCPEGHPDRHHSLGGLAVALRDRYLHSGSVGDLEESISFYRAALLSRSDTHPDSSWLLFGLAYSLYSVFEKEGRIESFDEVVVCLSRAAICTVSRVIDTWRAAHTWALWARRHGHRTTLEAYKTAMSTLQRALTIRPNLSSRHEFLSSDSRHRTLALDATSYAIERGDLAQAIEFLEQGRALLWSQMRGFRSPLEQLSRVDASLADRFKECARALEVLTTSLEPRSSTWGPDAIGAPAGGLSQLMQTSRSVDEMLVRIRQLSEEQENLVNEIRSVPGFEDFLRASPFSVLRQSASEGPVIVLNHSAYRCDALIIISNREVPCISVPLDDRFYDDTNSLYDEFTRVRRECEVHSIEYDDVLRRVMGFLWDRVVFKIVQKLKELGSHEGSRIWWCPTSVLSAFPFHAAGPYKGNNGSMTYLLDDYICSYTPTLKSLIEGRSGIQNESRKLLVIGDEQLSSEEEINAIRPHKRVNKRLLGEQASRDAVMKALQKVQWVHFVCHGRLDNDPFQSSLELADGGLTLMDIIRSNLPNAEFAYLSACHTAEQGPGFAQDEVLHLAAAMQFSGFRSVIGTMWQLLDGDGPFLVEAVYAYLDDAEGIAYKSAAAAVRDATVRLRNLGNKPGGTLTGMMVERWVNLVHIGA